MSSRKKTFTAASVLLFCSLVITISCYTAAMMSKNWLYETATGVEKGLWRHCHNGKDCQNFAAVLHFTTNKVADCVLLINIFADLFSLIALFVLMVELCVMKVQICSMVILLICTSLSAFNGVLLMTFAETLLKRDNINYRWGFYVAYVGMVAASFAFLFSVIAFCTRPIKKKEPSYKDDPLVMRINRGDSYEYPRKDYILRANYGLDNQVYAR